jgi:hypothetical protein
MLTGPEALNTIDHSLQQLRSQLQEVDQQVQEASKDVMQLQQKTAQRFRDLAQFRLDRLLSDKISAALDEIDQRVAKLLAARDEELAELERRLSDNQQRQSELERERESQRQRVNEAIQKLDVAQAKTQKRLQADPGYRERLEEAQRADVVAREAESKTQQAESDRMAKGAPYEADPLFMYLWRRGYGTSTYRANPLTRFLDGWVARICKYHNARPNYYMLLEIPTRLREHAQKVRADAQQLLEPLKQEEQRAADADGIPQHASTVHSAQQSLAELDARIREGEGAYRQLSEQRAAYVAGKDENFRKCLEATAYQLEREPLLSLRHHAAATPGPQDDVLVDELSDFEHRRKQFTNTLQGYQQIHDRHLVRVHETENIRHRFKRHDFDDYGSVFSNENVIEAIFSQFLRGLASADELWDVLRGNHRRRQESDPTFGTGGIRIVIPNGGFGLPGGGFELPSGGIRFPKGGFDFPGGGGWRIPAPPSNGPWYGPSAGGGRDGFRTTGGF